MGEKEGTEGENTIYALGGIAVVGIRSKEEPGQRGHWGGVQVISLYET